MPVTYIVRSPGTGHSIETLFSNVWQAFVRQTGETARVVHLPHISRNLVNVWKNSRFLWKLKKYGETDEIFHVTGDAHYAVLALPPARTVLTIHDCSTLVNNRKRPLHYAFFWLFWYYLPVCRAGAVTVVSKKTRHELIQFIGRVAEKAVVVPNGCPPDFEPVSFPQKNVKPVLLQIGTAPNKNLSRLLEAIQSIPCKLLIVGRLNTCQLGNLCQYKIDYENFIDVDDVTIRILYARCDIVTFLSTYEGFGMPVLESNACGLPVIASDIDPVRYIAGDAACLINPTDTSAIRVAVLRVVNDDAYRQQLIVNGLENARRFTIDQTAAQYRTVYQQVSAIGITNYPQPEPA